MTARSFLTVQPVLGTDATMAWTRVDGWTPTSPAAWRWGTTGAAVPLGRFTGSLAWLASSHDPAFLGEPETGGCAERWIRTLKDQCLWFSSRTPSTSSARPWPACRRDNSSWLIQRHGHQTRRRPIRQHKRQQRHDQVGTTSIKKTRHCSLESCLARGSC
jgi:hypothetical protein